MIQPVYIPKENFDTKLPVQYYVVAVCVLQLECLAYENSALWPSSFAFFFLTILEFIYKVS